MESFETDRKLPIAEKARESEVFASLKEHKLI